MRMMILVIFFGMVSAYGISAIRFPWMKQRFDVSDKDFAPLRVVQAVSNLVACLFIMKPAFDYLGLFWLMVVCWCATIVTDMVYISAPNLQYLYLQTPFQSASILCAPAVNAWFLNVARPGQLAQGQAVFSQIMSVTGCVGALLYAGIMTSALATQLPPIIASSAPFAFDIVLAFVALAVLLTADRESFDFKEAQVGKAKDSKETHSDS